MKNKGYTMNTTLSEIQKDMDDFFVEMDNEVYDHSIDIIDPDEPELPGPPYDSYGYNDEDLSYLDSLQTTGFETEIDLDRDVPEM